MLIEPLKANASSTFRTALRTEVDDFMDLDDFGPPTAEDILHGTHAIDLSHAGGEFFELVSEDMKKSR